MVLGKRPRETREARHPQPAADLEPGSESDAGIRAVLQRHFEARFKPLEDLKTAQVEVAEIQTDTGNDDLSEWSGISISDPEENVEVVQCSSVAGKKVEVSKEERKAFMTAKPPIHGAKSGTRISSNETKRELDDEADNLKNDLALQRLLRESHLLDVSSSLSPTGNNRHKAIDLHLQTVGAKASILTQEKMPMAHRKGIFAKAKRVEEKRRKEARENGIILEKAEKKSKSARSKIRDRGVSGPGVGKFKGGTLRLSKHDLADIKGTGARQSGTRKRLRR
ncbi:MAG: hypothetical protein M1816_003260 [Peltula sp. TS41687]|nr:MAG: hypothetical protein M1816_003260 [Peltula sp. TS41687]